MCVSRHERVSVARVCHADAPACIPFLDGSGDETIKRKEGKKKYVCDLAAILSVP